MDVISSHIAVWFEIPSTDFERALTFYKNILDVEIVVMDENGLKQGLLPHTDQSLVSGSIVHGLDYKPSTEGCVVYLNGGHDLAVVLERVIAQGGSIHMPKTHLGDDIGYIAQFIDTEGNRIGIHSVQ